MEERFQTFTVLIANVNRYIRRIKTEEMAEFQLKSHHVSCLYYLYREKELTAKELCSICEEDKAIISRATAYLEERGYLTCKAKNKKRYQSPFTLTEVGKELGRLVSEKVDRVLQQASEGLSDAHREIFYQSLAKISTNLQKICDDYDAADGE